MTPDMTTPDDWSCEHGGRWIHWQGGWMQVVAPMSLDGMGRTRRICDCRPPGGDDEPVVGVME